MIKALRIASVVVAAGAALAVVFLVIGFFTGGTDAETDKLLKAPGIVEEFLKSMSDKVTAGGDDVPALVMQAKALGNNLEPPPPPPPPPTDNEGAAPPQPVIETPVITAKFNVLGTSFFAADPNRSFALVDEAGGELKWVKQGEKVGQFVFEQIREGVVVLRDGQRTQEMAAIRTPQPSIIKGEGGAPTGTVGSAPPIPASMMPMGARDRITSRTTPARSVPAARTATPPEIDEAGAKMMDEFVEKMKAMQAEAGTGTNAAPNEEEAAKLMEELMAGMKAGRISDEEAQKLEEMGQQLDNQSTAEAPAPRRGRRLPSQGEKTETQTEAQPADANASPQE